MIGRVTYILPGIGSVYEGILDDPRTIEYRVEVKKFPGTDQPDEGRVWLVGYDRNWRETEAVRMQLNEAATIENQVRLMVEEDEKQRKPAPGADYDPD